MAYSKLLAEESADADDFGLGEDYDSDSEDDCNDIYGYLGCPIILQGYLFTDSCREVDNDTGSCEEDEEDDRMAANSSAPNTYTFG